MNLAHGSLFTFGATLSIYSDSFTLAVAGAVMGTVLLALEVALMRRPQVFSVIYLLGAALAGLAGALMGTLSAVKTGQRLPMLAFLSRRASLH